MCIYIFLGGKAAFERPRAAAYWSHFFCLGGKFVDMGFGGVLLICDIQCIVYYILVMYVVEHEGAMSRCISRTEEVSGAVG